MPSMMDKFRDLERHFSRLEQQAAGVMPMHELDRAMGQAYRQNLVPAPMRHPFITASHAILLTGLLLASVLILVNACLVFQAAFDAPSFDAGVVMAKEAFMQLCVAIVFGKASFWLMGARKRREG